tara:strand:+ start:3315 stop:3578 length:264 start_codon:yes stop_codon:yes gene_type:complete
MTKNIIQLTKDELNNIHQMIETYKKKYDEIGNLEKTLKTLNNTRDQIKEQLEKVRNDEQLFGKKLIEKYGKGKFNIQTFEYELEEQK